MDKGVTVTSIKHRWSKSPEESKKEMNFREMKAKRSKYGRGYGR